MKTKLETLPEEILAFTLDHCIDLKEFDYNSPNKHEFKYSDWKIQYVLDPNNIVKSIFQEKHYALFSEKSLYQSNLKLYEVKIQILYNDEEQITFTASTEINPNNSNNQFDPTETNFYVYTSKPNTIHLLNKELNNKNEIIFSINKNNYSIVHFCQKNNLKGKTWGSHMGQNRLENEITFIDLFRTNMQSVQTFADHTILGNSFLSYSNEKISDIMDHFSDQFLNNVVSKSQKFESKCCGEFIHLGESNLHQTIEKRFELLHLYRYKFSYKNRELIDELANFYNRMDKKRFICTNQVISSFIFNPSNLFDYFESVYYLSTKLGHKSFDEFINILKFYFNNTNIDRELEELNFDLDFYLELFIIEKFTFEMIIEVTILMPQKRSSDHFTFWQNTFNYLVQNETPINIESDFFNQLATVLQKINYRRIPYLEEIASKHKSFDFVLQDMDDLDLIEYQLKSIKQVFHVKKSKIMDGILLQISLVNGNIILINFHSKIQCKGFVLIKNRLLFNLNHVNLENFLTLNMSENMALKYIYHVVDGSIRNKQQLSKKLSIDITQTIEKILSIQFDTCTDIESFDIQSKVYKKVIEKNPFKSIIGVNYLLKKTLFHLSKFFSPKIDIVKLRDLPPEYQSSLSKTIIRRQKIKLGKSTFQMVRQSPITNLEFSGSFIELLKFAEKSFLYFLEYAKAIIVSKLRNNSIIVVSRNKSVFPNQHHQELRFHNIYFQSILKTKLERDLS